MGLEVQEVNVFDDWMHEGKVYKLVKSDLTQESGCYDCAFNDGTWENCPADMKENLICTKPGYNAIWIERDQSITFTAPSMLQKASELMVERAAQYDSPEGERSMEKIVNSFNSITGHRLTESEGWMFMILLKLVRDNTREVGHQDSCEDLIAYSSLYGESRLSK